MNPIGNAGTPGNVNVNMNGHALGTAGGQLPSLSFAQMLGNKRPNPVKQLQTSVHPKADVGGMQQALQQSKMAEVSLMALFERNGDTNARMYKAGEVCPNSGPMRSGIKAPASEATRDTRSSTAGTNTVTLAGNQPLFKSAGQSVLQRFAYLKAAAMLGVNPGQPQAMAPPPGPMGAPPPQAPPPGGGGQLPSGAPAMGGGAPPPPGGQPPQGGQPPPPQMPPPPGQPMAPGQPPMGQPAAGTTPLAPPPPPPQHMRSQQPGLMMDQMMGDKNDVSHGFGEAHEDINDANFALGKIASSFKDLKDAFGINARHLRKQGAINIAPPAMPRTPETVSKVAKGVPKAAPVLPNTERAKFGSLGMDNMTPHDLMLPENQALLAGGLAGGSPLIGMGAASKGGLYGALAGLGYGAAKGHPVKGGLRGAGKGISIGGGAGLGMGLGGAAGTLLNGQSGGFGTALGMLAGGLAGGYGGHRLGNAVLGEEGDYGDKNKEKHAAQDNDQPQLSATGDSKGLSYAHKPDHYAQGHDAWKSVSGYFKGSKHIKEEPNPFTGQHKSSQDKEAAGPPRPQAQHPMAPPPSMRPPTFTPRAPTIQNTPFVGQLPGSASYTQPTLPRRPVAPPPGPSFMGSMALPKPVTGGGGSSGTGGDFGPQGGQMPAPQLPPPPAPQAVPQLPPPPAPRGGPQNGQQPPAPSSTPRGPGSSPTPPGSPPQAPGSTPLPTPQGQPAPPSFPPQRPRPPRTPGSEDGQQSTDRDPAVQAYLNRRGERATQPNGGQPLNAGANPNTSGQPATAANHPLRNMPTPSSDQLQKMMGPGTGQRPPLTGGQMQNMMGPGTGVPVGAGASKGPGAGSNVPGVGANIAGMAQGPGGQLPSDSWQSSQTPAEARADAWKARMVGGPTRKVLPTAGASKGLGTGIPGMPKGGFDKFSMLNGAGSLGKIAASTLMPGNPSGATSVPAYPKQQDLSSRDPHYQPQATPPKPVTPQVPRPPAANPIYGESIAREPRQQDLSYRDPHYVGQATPQPAPRVAPPMSSNPIYGEKIAPYPKQQDLSYRAPKPRSSGGASIGPPSSMPPLVGATPGMPPSSSPLGLPEIGSDNLVGTLAKMGAYRHLYGDMAEFVYFTDHEMHKAAFGDSDQAPGGSKSSGSRAQSPRAGTGGNIGNSGAGSKAPKPAPQAAPQPQMTPQAPQQVQTPPAMGQGPPQAPGMGQPKPQGTNLHQVPMPGAQISPQKGQVQPMQQMPMGQTAVAVPVHVPVPARQPSNLEMTQYGQPTVQKAMAKNINKLPPSPQAQSQQPRPQQAQAAAPQTGQQQPQMAQPAPQQPQQSAQQPQQQQAPKPAAKKAMDDWYACGGNEVEYRKTLDRRRQRAEAQANKSAAFDWDAAPSTDEEFTDMNEKRKRRLEAKLARRAFDKMSEDQFAREFGQFLKEGQALLG